MGNNCLNLPILSFFSLQNIRRYFKKILKYFCPYNECQQLNPVDFHCKNENADLFFISTSCMFHRMLHALLGSDYRIFVWSRTCDKSGEGVGKKLSCVLMWSKECIQTKNTRETKCGSLNNDVIRREFSFPIGSIKRCGFSLLSHGDNAGSKYFYRIPQLFHNE